MNARDAVTQMDGLIRQVVDLHNQALAEGLYRDRPDLKIAMRNLLFNARDIDTTLRHDPAPIPVPHRDVHQMVGEHLKID